MRICKFCETTDISNQIGNCFANNGAIAKELYNLFKVIIVEMEDTPALICKKCEKHMMQASEFKKLVKKAERDLKSSLKNEHYLFHENLRELKNQQAALEEATSKCVVDTKDPDPIESFATPEDDPTEPVSKEEIPDPVLQEVPERSVTESLRILNEIELEDFWKEADNMLVEVLDDLDSQDSQPVENTTAVPVTKFSSFKIIKKKRKKRNNIRWYNLKKKCSVTIREIASKDENLNNETEKPVEPSPVVVAPPLLSHPNVTEPVTVQQDSKTLLIFEKNIDKTVEEVDSIMISSDEESTTTVSNNNNSKCSSNDIFSNMTTQQLKEMTDMISCVLPLQRKNNKKTNKKTYMNKIKIDVKSSKIIDASTSTPVPTVKRRESLLKLPKFRIVKKTKPENG